VRDLRHRRRKRVTAVVVAGAVGSVAVAGAVALIVPGSAQADGASVSALLKNAAGQSVGTASLSQVRASVDVNVLVHGLTPGFHGFHVHTAGVCEPGDSGSADFISAGGHFHRGGAAPHPNHAGDFPVLLVNADRKGELRFTTSAFTIADLLRNAAGTALIIHADPDNYANIPTRYSYLSADGLRVPGPDATTLLNGDSGARVACGVLTAPHPIP